MPGAVRLGRVAAGNGDLAETLCRRPPAEARIESDPRMADLLGRRYERFRDLFERTAEVL